MLVTSAIGPVPTCVCACASILVSTLLLPAIARGQVRPSSTISAEAAQSFKSPAATHAAHDDAAIAARARKLFDLAFSSKDGHQLKLKRSATREVLYRRDYVEELFIIAKSGTIYSFYTVGERLAWKWSAKLVPFHRDIPLTGALEFYLAAHSKRASEERLGPKDAHFLPDINDLENPLSLNSYRVLANGTLVSIPARKSEPHVTPSSSTRDAEERCWRAAPSQ